MIQEDEATEYLGPLLTDPSRTKREAVRRRKPFDEMSVSADDIPDHEAKGWQVDRKLKRKTRVRREKEIDERLENRFWMLLFKLGYPELSDGRDFKILIERKGAERLRKQIDVLQSLCPVDTADASETLRNLPISRGRSQTQFASTTRAAFMCKARRFPHL